MAISVISYNNLGGKFRLDASFYREEYLKNNAELSSKKNVDILHKLGKTYEKTYDPSKKPTDFFDYLDISNVDITDGTIDIKKIIGYEAPSRARRKVSENALIISTVRPNRNAITLITEEFKEIIVSTGFFVFIPEKIDPYYLFAYLKTKYSINQLMKQVSNAMYPTVLPEDISNLMVYTPDSIIQKKIRNRIERAFILKKESKILINEALKTFEDMIGINELNVSKIQNISHSTFLKNLRLDSTYYKTEYIELIENLSKQRYKKIRDLCTLRNGFPFESEYFDIGNHPLVKIANITLAEINPKMCFMIPKEYFERTNFKKAKENNILIGMDGTDEFRGAIITSNLIDVAINQRISILNIKDKIIDPYYLLLVINSKVGQYQLVREKSLASTVGHISNEIIKEVIIPILDDKSISKISSLVRESFKKNYEAQSIIETSIKELEVLINTKE